VILQWSTLNSSVESVLSVNLSFCRNLAFSFERFLRAENQTFHLTQALGGRRKEQDWAEKNVAGNVTSFQRNDSQANINIDNSCWVVILIILGGQNSFPEGDAVNNSKSSSQCYVWARAHICGTNNSALKYCAVRCVLLLGPAFFTYSTVNRRRTLGSSRLLSQRHRTVLCRYTAPRALCGTVSLGFTSEQEGCGLTCWYCLLRWKHQAQSSCLCQWSVLVLRLKIKANDDLICVVSFQVFRVFWGKRVRSVEHFVWSMWEQQPGVLFIRLKKQNESLTFSSWLPSPL